MKFLNVYVMLNGALTPAESASVSIYDRGLRFGDGVFETIAVMHGLPYLWQEHIARLNNGLDALMIGSTSEHVTEQRLYADAVALIEQNQISQGMVRIMVTRGQGSEGYLPTHATPPTVIIEATETAQGCAADHAPITLSVSKIARLHPATLPTHAKLMQGLNPTLARLQARATGADEALMLDVSGNISEAASGNLLWQQGSVFYTAHADTGCLSGTMLHRLAQLLNQPIHHVIMPCGGLKDCDALIMTNAMKGTVAVSNVAHGQAHYHFPHSKRLADYCNQFIQKDIAQRCARA